MQDIFDRAAKQLDEIQQHPYPINIALGSCIIADAIRSAAIALQRDSHKSPEELTEELKTLPRDDLYQLRVTLQAERIGRALQRPRA